MNINDIFITKHTWSTFSESELDEYIERVFNYYREYGFPYFKLNSNEVHSIFNKMKSFDTNRLLLDDNILSQVMLGLNLVNSFMPHMWDVRCHAFKSPMDCFNSDDMLRKAIRKRVQLADNMSHAGMRKVLSWTSGHHRVSNFRPTVAKYIYDNYSGNGNVLDVSSGFGGRLLGALSSKSVIKYTGIEPSTQTYNGLLEMSSKLKRQESKWFRYDDDSTEINILNFPVEDVSFDGGEFDLIFSSPPYFNTERYSDEDTQSFKRYPTKLEWRDKFLTPLIRNSYKWINKNGYFIINVADVKTYTDLEDDVVEISTAHNFKLIKTYKMTLSSLMSSGFKYEPIFVFKK